MRTTHTKAKRRNENIRLAILGLIIIILGLMYMITSSNYEQVLKNKNLQIVELQQQIETLNKELEIKQAVIDQITDMNYKLSNSIIVEKTANKDLTLKITELTTPKVVHATEKPKVNVIAKIQTVFTNTVNKKSNLNSRIEITVAQMDSIIDYWDNRCGGSPFKGQGAAFIKASEITGLDPVYILAHAAQETGWGRSQMAREKNNYFGINAKDGNTSGAYSMGDSLEAGIIEGAQWIKTNYYDKGYTSLYDMIYTAPYAYASAKDGWINNIVSIMNSSYKKIL